MIDFWLLLSANLLAISCCILGCFLVMRKMAMVGDAISHSILPGLAIAFLISGTRSGPLSILGAAIFGIICTYLIDWFHRKLKLQTDAAIGTSFNILFSFGIILISLYPNIDLDQDCVLYGELIYIPLDMIQIGTITMPSQLINIISLFIIIIVLSICFYRPFFISSFDSEYAQTIGINSRFWHFAILTLVSITSVIGFESIGAILILAFLILPSASAYILVKTTKQQLILSIVISLFCTNLGYFISKWLNISVSGSIAFLNFICFIILFLLLNIIKKRNYF